MRHIAVCLLLLTPTASLAQDAKAQAAAIYKDGVADFKAKKFAVAITKFETAYKLDPSPILLYNLARAHEELGQAQKAVENFQLYLARAPKAEDRADVERRIRIMQAIVERERVALAAAEAKAEQEAAARAAAEAQAEQAAAQQTAQPEPEPPVTVTAPVEPAPQRPTWRRWTAYGLLGAGAAGVVVGAVFLGEMADAEDAHKAATTGEDKAATADDAESAATKANVGLITGGVLLVGGAGLLVWDLLDDGTDGSSAWVAPTDQGVFAGYQGRF